jgi:hypothetical protein
MLTDVFDQLTFGHGVILSRLENSGLEPGPCRFY